MQDTGVSLSSDTRPCGPTDVSGRALMWCVRLNQGLLFGDLDPETVSTLKGVPMLLESTDDRVRERLLPETSSDPDEEEYWRQHAVPELERLFLSRAQLVQRDLERLSTLGIDGRPALLIPNEHTNAWLSALNAARLALFVLNDLQAVHMTPDGFDLLDGKQREAVLRIDLLAAVQSVLLGDLEVTDGGDLEDFETP